MSALWTAADAAAATGGRARGDWAAGGLSIDSRSLAPGDLFIALTDRRDGHDFVAAALSAGAAAALVSRVPDGVSSDAPLLIVDDVQAALEGLGRAGRARTRARVVAVTGSVGKTSTKEMLRRALSEQGKVHAAEKSFNNHWGVPLTLARCPRDCDFAVIEIGMNHPGEIAPLAAMAAPDAAIVTTVAPAHLAAFENIEGIAHEKAAIFSGLRSGGTAIYNGDVATAPVLRAAAEIAGTAVSFGQGAGCDVSLTALVAGPSGSGGRISLGGSSYSLSLSVPGAHLAQNACAVLAACAALGADPGRAAAALSDWRPPAGRGTRETVQLESGAAFVLVDDAYNANPASVAAALSVLAAATPRGRRIAILGDMLELGPTEAALHADLARHPAMDAIAPVHCCGPRMAHLWQALPPERRGIKAACAADLAADAEALAAAGDEVLIKGSLGSGLAVVADALRARAARRKDD